MTVEEYLKRLKILDKQIINNPDLLLVYSDVQPFHKIKRIERYLENQTTDLDTALALFPD